jgi:hypothetical protein
MFPDPSSSFQTKLIFYSRADCVTPTLIEVCIFTEKDGHMGLTKIAVTATAVSSQVSQHKNTSCMASVNKTWASDQNISQTN